MTNQEAYEIMCDKAEKYDKIMNTLQEILQEIEKEEQAIDDAGGLDPRKAGIGQGMYETRKIIKKHMEKIK